jgi:hypothetical protein
MPYHIVKSRAKSGGYYVVDSKNKKYSKKPMTKLKATKQKKALQINTKK